MKIVLITIACGFVFILLIILILYIIARKSFEKGDRELDWNDHYAECQRPYIALKDKCSHTDKRLVVVDASFICEETWIICEDCGEVLNRSIDC